MSAINEQIAEQFVQQLARNALEGIGPLEPAERIADEALLNAGNDEAAIEELVREHTRLAAVGGFVTGLGGFVVLPVAIPANLLGFYTLAARLVAAIAHIRGHDISLPETRMAVLMALTGDEASQLLARAGVIMPSGGLTGAAVRRLAPSTRAMVNKAIGFKLLVGAGQKMLVRLGRAIPFAGGLVGGVVDATMMRSIAAHARREFQRADDLLGEAGDAGPAHEGGGDGNDADQGGGARTARGA